MTVDAPSDSQPTFNGLIAIIVVQIAALLYLWYDDLFVTDEPQHTLMVIVSCLSVAIIIGLILRKNAARLALMAFSILSIFLTSLELLVIFLGIGFAMTADLLSALFLTSIIPLAFTIWVVVYLNREEVRVLFVGDASNAHDGSAPH